MKMLVADKLDGHKLKEEIMEVIECESGFNATIQSFHPDPNGPNGREDSWGLVQINLPSHTEVTREQAQDWKFSLGFIKNNFKAGKKIKWSCEK